MNRCLTSLLLAVVWSPLCPAQDAPKPQDPVAEMFKLFEAQGLRVDPKAGTIIVPTEVGRPDQPLEFLLIHRRGKAHEAVVITDVKGSVLNAAMLALGFQNGENARVVDKDPLPTPEEVAKGAPIFEVFPPKGMQVWFTAKWKRVDADGNEVDVEVPVEDMILDTTTGRALEGAEWIFLGGQMTPLYRGEPPVFVADFEGNYVSIVYKSPPNHLVTMKHERADDDQIWWLTDLVPPVGTKVELTIHKAKSKLHEAREKRLAEQRKEREGAGAGETKKDG